MTPSATEVSRFNAMLLRAVIETNGVVATKTLNIFFFSPQNFEKT
jgi:hypothetical protein